MRFGRGQADVNPVLVSYSSGDSTGATTGQKRTWALATDTGHMPTSTSSLAALGSWFLFFPHNGLQAGPPSSRHPILTWSLFSCGAWVPKIYLIVWDPEKMSFSLPNIESMIWSLSYQFGLLPKTHNNQWIPVYLLLRYLPLKQYLWNQLIYTFRLTKEQTKQ